jgi:hypothetical protein
MTSTAIRTDRRNLVQRIDRLVKRVQVEGFHPGSDAISNFEIALEYFERADYQASEDAMIWGKYGFAPRFSRLALRHLFLSSSSASGHCAPSSAETDRIPSPTQRLSTMTRCSAANA